MTFGTETDLRDFMGELVISHDIADSRCMRAEDFFSLCNEAASRQLILALNIIADGLHKRLLQLLQAHNTKKHLCLIRL